MPIFIDTSGKEFYIDGANEGAQIPVFAEYYGGVQQSFWGVTGTPIVGPALGTSTAVTDVPPAGNKIVITDLVLSSSAVTTFIFQEETSGFVLFRVIVPQNATVSYNVKSKLKTPTAGKRVMVQPNQVGVIVNIGYFFEP